MKDSLISHQTTVNEKKTVKCKNCQKYFGGKGDRNRHQRTVHEYEEQFKCVKNIL